MHTTQSSETSSCTKCFHRSLRLAASFLIRYSISCTLKIAPLFVALFHLVLKLGCHCLVSMLPFNVNTLISFFNFSTGFLLHSLSACSPSEITLSSSITSCSLFHVCLIIASSIRRRIAGPLKDRKKCRSILRNVVILIRHCFTAGYGF